MRRHERPRTPAIRVELPIGKNYADLSIAERRTIVWFQLKQLGPPSKQPLITCLCGHRVPAMFAYRCYECGVFFCPKCASKHFDTNRGKIKRKMNYDYSNRTYDRILHLNEI